VGITATADAAGYVASGRRSVPGWFKEIDGRLFTAISEAQVATGTPGHLLEIGAYQGQSAILLGYLSGEGEQVIVSDTFCPDDTQDLKNYGGLTVERFLSHWRRFHPGDPSVILGPSADLKAEDVGRCRLVHIDGSHLYEAVRGDVGLAASVACPGAVVILDDLRSPHTPGVAAAAWEAVANG
jgi:hypothetical protein